MQRWLLGSLLGLALPLLLAPLVALGQTTMTITPPAGPYGTVFEQQVSGLPPGIGVVGVIRDPTGGEHPGPGLGVVPPNGEWRISSNDAWRAVPPEPVGEYTALIKTIDGVTVLATATFTVTGPADQTPTPGAVLPSTLPRTGDLRLLAPLLAGLGAGLIGAGYAARRRAGH